MLRGNLPQLSHLRPGWLVFSPVSIIMQLAQSGLCHESPGPRILCTLNASLRFLRRLVICLLRFFADCEKFEIPVKVLVEFAFVVSALLYKFVIGQVPGLGLAVLTPGDGREAPPEDLGLDHHVPEHCAGQLQGGDGPVVKEGEHRLEQGRLHNQHQEVAWLEFCI